MRVFEKIKQALYIFLMALHGLLAMKRITFKSLTTDLTLTVKDLDLILLLQLGVEFTYGLEMSTDAWNEENTQINF